MSKSFTEYSTKIARKQTSRPSSVIDFPNGKTAISKAPHEINTRFSHSLALSVAASAAVDDAGLTHFPFDEHKLFETFATAYYSALE